MHDHFILIWSNLPGIIRKIIYTSSRCSFIWEKKIKGGGGAEITFIAIGE